MRKIGLVIAGAISFGLVLWAQAPAAAPKAATAPKAVAPKAAAPSAGKPVATPMELMHAMTDPGSKAIWGVALKAPADAKDWAALENNAVLVAESGNLLLRPGVAKAQGKWAAYAQMLVKTGTASLKAAKAKDLDKLMDAGDEMVESCDACHNDYMKK